MGSDPRIGFKHQRWSPHQHQCSDPRIDLGRQIEAMERPKAAERQGRRTDLETLRSDDLKVTVGGRARDRVGGVEIWCRPVSKG